MTTEEFSNEFDVLVDSYRRFRDFDAKEAEDTIEFNEYEKSSFLTKAQEQLVVSYYNGENNKLKSFEETEEIRRYLSNLVKTEELEEYSGENEIITLTNNSHVFSLPEDLWFITYELVKLESSSDSCLSEKEVQVIPVTQDTLYRTLENPFKGIGYRRVLRLDIKDNKVELISKYAIDKYIVRYVSKLNPIILVKLPNELSINEETEITECELHEALHRPILELAVTLALQSKGININK